MTIRTGVYFCRCGTNITEAVDIDRLVEQYAADARVSVCAAHDFLCAPAGREFLTAEIRDRKLERVVVVACSPREHETTFRNVCAGAGLNPYLCQLVNVREHCAWVHSDKAAATAKAGRLTEAGLRRVLLQQPLEQREIDCVTDTLVIGGGVAGISAALALAEARGMAMVVTGRRHFRH